MQETPEQTTAAPAPKSSREHHSFFGLWFWGLIPLFLVYPLSIGPAARIARDYPATQPALMAVYRPLELAAGGSPPIKRFFKWYIRFWRG